MPDTKLPAPSELLEQAARWEHLTRWERAELGRALRMLGWTYSEIQEVVPAPKGTLSGWCSEIRLSQDQIAAIKARRPPGVREGVPVDTGRKRRQEIQRIRAEALLKARGLLGDPFWMAGACLYWAEGAKTRRRLEMTNSDPRLLRLFIGWVRTYHEAEAEFTLHLHLHEGNDEPAARSYWSGALSLTDPSFNKTFIKPRGTGHRKNKLPWGVCRVAVRRSTDSWVRTMAWTEMIAECFAGKAASSTRVSLDGGPLAQLGSATDS